MLCVCKPSIAVLVLNIMSLCYFSLLCLCFLMYGAVFNPFINKFVNFVDCNIALDQGFRSYIHLCFVMKFSYSVVCLSDDYIVLIVMFYLVLHTPSALCVFAYSAINTL